MRSRLAQFVAALSLSVLASHCAHTSPTPSAEAPQAPLTEEKTDTLQSLKSSTKAKSAMTSRSALGRFEARGSIFVSFVENIEKCEDQCLTSDCKAVWNKEQNACELTQMVVASVELTQSGEKWAADLYSGGTNFHECSYSGELKVGPNLWKGSKGEDEELCEVILEYDPAKDEMNGSFESHACCGASASGEIEHAKRVKPQTEKKS